MFINRKHLMCWIRSQILRTGIQEMMFANGYVSSTSDTGLLNEKIERVREERRRLLELENLVSIGDGNTSVDAIIAEAERRQLWDPEYFAE